MGGLNSVSTVDGLKDSDIFAILAASGLACKQKVYGFELLLDRIWRSGAENLEVFSFSNESELYQRIDCLNKFKEDGYKFVLYLSYSGNIPVLIVQYYC